MPPQKWTDEEIELLKQVRERLRDKFEISIKDDPVIGDNKLMRFVRGHNHKLEKICEMVERYLDFRQEHKVDDIYKDIINNKIDTPDKFPYNDKIHQYCDIFIFHPNMKDKDGSYVTFEGSINPEIFSDEIGVKVEEFSVGFPPKLISFTPSESGIIFKFY